MLKYLQIISAFFSKSMFDLIVYNSLYMKNTILIVESCYIPYYIDSMQSTTYKHFKTTELRCFLKYGSRGKNLFYPNCDYLRY